MVELREGLLRSGFSRVADNPELNNELNLGGIPRERRLLTATITGMKQLIQDYGLKFDLVIPVPDHANWLGVEVATSHAANYLPLRKQGAGLALREDEQSIEAAGGIVIVETVMTDDLTAVNEVLGLPGVMERTMAVLGVFDRGDPQAREPLPEHILLKSLVEEHIPPTLPPDSDLWRYADGEPTIEGF